MLQNPFPDILQLLNPNLKYNHKLWGRSRTTEQTAITTNPWLPNSVFRQCCHVFLSSLPLFKNKHFLSSLCPLTSQPPNPTTSQRKPPFIHTLQEDGSQWTETPSTSACQVCKPTHLPFNVLFVGDALLPTTPNPPLLFSETSLCQLFLLFYLLHVLLLYWACSTLIVLRTLNLKASNIFLKGGRLPIWYQFFSF